MKFASFELLEFLLSPMRHKYYVISLPGSPAEQVTKANYPLANILVPDLSTTLTADEKQAFYYRANEKIILKETNSRRLIREHHIEALAPDTYSEPYLEVWAKRNKIHIVCTPHRYQKKYENKLFFDRFLHKHSLPVPRSLTLKSLQDIEKVEHYPIILQAPESIGSAGTKLINNKEALVHITSTDKKMAFPLLCREYIGDGIPIGVSVLIGPKKMLFSAIRMQAYFTQPSGKSSYYGIQWMKTSSLPVKVIEKLNESLAKAGLEMQKKGFLGIAAFDLIVRGDDIFFIECNPRTGGSTPQMAFNSELLHGLHFTEEYIRIMTGNDLSVHKPFIPDSVFEGFTLDIGFMTDFLPPGLDLNCLRNGVHKYENDCLSFLSEKLDNLGERSNVYVHYVRPEGAVLDPNIFMGFILTHFPLLEINGKQYTFSEEAAKLLKHVEDILIKK